MKKVSGLTSEETLVDLEAKKFPAAAVNPALLTGTSTTGSLRTSA
jgi:hypothetical protein